MKLQLFGQEAIAMTQSISVDVFKQPKLKKMKRTKGTIIISYNHYSCDGDGFKNGDRFISVMFDTKMEGSASPCNTQEEADKCVADILERYKDTHEIEIIDKTTIDTFESDWIKQLDETGENDSPIFEYKDKVTLARKNAVNNLLFLVCEEYKNKRDDEERGDWLNDVGGEGMTFKDRTEATTFFVDKVAELKSLKEKSDNNIVFDGRRYFLRIDENNKVLGRAE